MYQSGSVVLPTHRHVSPPSKLIRASPPRLVLLMGWHAQCMKTFAKTKAPRKRRTSWKQRRCELLANVAARLSQLGGDEIVLWRPRMHPTGRHRMSTGSLSDATRTVQNQRRPKPDGTVGTRCLAHLDEQGQHAQKCPMGRDRASLHDVGCHIIHSACCEGGLKSQREVIFPSLATEVDGTTSRRGRVVVRWSSAPTARLHSRERGCSAPLLSRAERSRGGPSCGSSRTGRS